MCIRCLLVGLQSPMEIVFAFKESSDNWIVQASNVDEQRDWVRHLLGIAAR